MGIFNKSKQNEPLPTTVMPTLNLNTVEAKAPVQKPHAEELTQIRQCIEDVTSELRDSSSRQTAAMKRAASLTGLVSKMEMDMKQLRRLEIENKNMSRIIVDLESKLAQKSSWASELDSKLNDLDRRHSETREKYEVAQANLAASQDVAAQQDARIIDQEREIRVLTSRAETGEDKFQHADHSLQKLREALDTQGSELAQSSREVLELRSSLDELTTKYESKSKKGEATLVELKNLRLDFNEMKTKHVGLTGKLENTRYDLRTQRTVFDETIKRREEENLALKTAIDQLETQMRIKENMATHLDQEFITLRNELSNERGRTATLEQRLRQKSEEGERSGSALVKSKLEYEQLNAKFAATLEDFETMRRINQLQREKLERYASIGGVAAGQVMLNMDVTPVEEDQTLTIPEDVENVTVLKTATKPRKKT